MSDFFTLIMYRIVQLAEFNFLDAISLSRALHQYLPEKELEDHRKFLAVYGDLYLYIPENRVLRILLENGYRNAEDVKIAGMKKIAKIQGLGRLRATKVINSVNGRFYQADLIYGEQREKDRIWHEKEKLREQSGYYDYLDDQVVE